MLQELAGIASLMVLIIFGSATGCFIALELRAALKRRAAKTAVTPCPRWNHNTSAKPGKCGLPLTDYRCPVHGLIRETMPK